jgi:outer membrane receptor protein involved in Fe transport
VFIDGVYRSRVGVGLTELGQVDRIEVLRGPQGTLFGRNASAGLISVITARPSFTTKVNGELTLGNYDMRRLEVGATGGLTSTIAVRADAIYLKRDGFLTDVISGRDVNNRDRYLVRLQGLYKPNDDFSFRLIGDYSKRDEECCAATYLRAFNTTRINGQATETASTIAAFERALGARIEDDTFARRVSITPGRDFASKVKDYGISGEAVYDFGAAELTSISAYRYNDYNRGQDADFNNLDILYRPSDGDAFNRFKTFTQELRLQGSAFNDRLDWLVGGYVAREQRRVSDNLSYGADYERFTNCLLAQSLAASPTVPVAGSGAAANCNLVFQGARAQVDAALAPLTGPINTLLAIPPANRTAQQVATLAALQTQLAAAQAQPTVAPVLALTSIPGRPGFASLQATLLGATAPQAPAGFGGIGLRDDYDQKSNNIAFFTHNIFSITDALKLTLGLRYTRERKTLDANFTDNNVLCRTLTSLNGTTNPAAGLQALQQLPCVIPSVPGGTFRPAQGKRTESKLSGTAVVSFKPTQSTLTYASYSRGYKAGGFNLDRSGLNRTAVGSTSTNPGAAGGVTANSTLNLLEFEPEINDAFELGAKFNGRGIDVNVAAFHQSFRVLQLNTFNGLSKDDLKAGVVSKGIEVEVFTRPATDVTLNLGATFADTKYQKNLVGAGGRPLPPALFLLPGSRLSNSAAMVLTTSIGFNPKITDSGIRALFYTDARHSSKFNTGSDLFIEKIQDSYTVVNGRIGLQGPGGNWGVELWAQNLFNENYKQVVFNATLQGSGNAAAVRRGFSNVPTSSQLFGAFLAEPRTYGITLRTRL